MPDYSDLVDYIVKSIVDNPEAVDVTASDSRGRSQTVEIRLDPGDVGRVIGRGGRNIEAIRSLVKAAAIKDHKRVNVEVITDDDGVRMEPLAEATAEPAGGPDEPSSADEMADAAPVAQDEPLPEGTLE